MCHLSSDRLGHFVDTRVVHLLEHGLEVHVLVEDSGFSVKGLG